MTTILMGAVDTLEWWQVKPWVMSAKESGFDGEIWLITYRVSDAFLQEMEKAGVNNYAVSHTPFMTPIQHAVPGSPTVSHNLRFYHAWELLTRLGSKATHVIMTDVRDVIFQRNPAQWLKNYFADKLF